MVGKQVSSLTTTATLQLEHAATLAYISNSASSVLHNAPSAGHSETCRAGALEGCKDAKTSKIHTPILQIS